MPIVRYYSEGDNPFYGGMALAWNYALLVFASARDKRVRAAWEVGDEADGQLASKRGEVSAYTL